MKCTNCNSQGSITQPYPIPCPSQSWEFPQLQTLPCRICNGLGVKVERLPYQGPDTPEYKERIKLDPISEYEVHLTHEEMDQLGIPHGIVNDPLWCRW